MIIEPFTGATDTIIIVLQIRQLGINEVIGISHFGLIDRKEQISALKERKSERPRRHNCGWRRSDM
jgi:hypothetical protein